jgi:arabinogalactan oligomer/maltooligosaccharide transport system substrate-binding protein
LSAGQVRLAGKVLLALVLAGALAGCLRREPETVIRLTWWITYAADGDEYPAFQSIAEEFTERTGIVVELVPVPWDDIAPRGGAAPRLSSVIASGDGPDLWGPVPHTWLEPYVSHDQALALDPRQINSYNQTDPLAQHASRMNGQQYALPLLIDSVALIYNRVLVPKPPATFEELVQVAREHTEPNSDRWGLALPLLSPTHIYPFMDGYGGYLFGCQITTTVPPPDGPASTGAPADDYLCDPEDIGLNSAGSVQGIQLISDLYVRDHLFSPALADRSQMHQRAIELFAEGHAAMLIDGPWVLPALRDSEIDFGVARLPTLPGASLPPRALTVVHGLIANAHTKHPDQVLELMNEIAAPDSIARLTGTLNKAPVRRDIVRQAELEQARTWHDQASQGILLPPIPALDAVWAPWERALAEAIPNLRPVQEAMDQAQEQIKESLGEQDASREGS